jgi:hypothetical protein
MGPLSPQQEGQIAMTHTQRPHLTWAIPGQQIPLCQPQFQAVDCNKVWGHLHIPTISLPIWPWT